MEWTSQAKFFLQLIALHPEAQIPQLASNRTRVRTSLGSAAFLLGLFRVEAILPRCSMLKWSLRMHKQGRFRRQREIQIPMQKPSVTRSDECPSGLSHLRGPPSGGKPDEPFCFLRGQLTCHRLWVKFLFAKHHSSKVLLWHQPKHSLPLPKHLVLKVPNDF